MCAMWRADGKNVKIDLPFFLKLPYIYFQETQSAYVLEEMQVKNNQMWIKNKNLIMTDNIEKIL